MAKLQKATLDPTKISGRCGRLKCCLRYEDQVYTELCKRLPKINSWVETEQGVGQILEAQVLTQLVKVRLTSGRIIAIREDEILQRNVKPPPMPSEGLPEPRRIEKPSKPDVPVMTPEEKEEENLAEQAGPGEEKESASKKRRRRRRKKKKNSENQ
jgi:hypothetical protein